MLFFVTSITHAANDPNQGCPIGSKEKLVCEVIMCNPLGFMSDESREKCHKINLKFAAYLATLGPFQKPPKCYKRNQSCQKIGVMTNALINPEYCDGLATPAEQDACNEALEVYNNEDDDGDG